LSLESRGKFAEGGCKPARVVTKTSNALVAWFRLGEASRTHTFLRRTGEIRFQNRQQMEQLRPGRSKLWLLVRPACTVLSSKIPPRARPKLTKRKHEKRLDTVLGGLVLKGAHQNLLFDQYSPLSPVLLRKKV